MLVFLLLGVGIGLAYFVLPVRPFSGPVFLHAGRQLSWSSFSICAASCPSSPGTRHCAYMHHDLCPKEVPIDMTTNDLLTWLRFIDRYP